MIYGLFFPQVNWMKKYGYQIMHYHFLHDMKKVLSKILYPFRKFLSPTLKLASEEIICFHFQIKILCEMWEKTRNLARVFLNLLGKIMFNYGYFCFENLISVVLKDTPSSLQLYIISNLCEIGKKTRLNYNLFLHF